MISYVEANIEYTIEYCKQHIPQIVAVRPEASFLVWLDCRVLNISQEELVSLFIDKAHLALNEGAMFGIQGRGFMRLNVGTPRAILHQALEQLREAVSDFK